MSDILFHALRVELGIDPQVTVQLSSSNALDGSINTVHDHIAVLSLLCAQLLHHLGDPEDDEQLDEVQVLISTVDVLLLRLRNGAPPMDTAATRIIREIQGRLMDLTR